MESLTQEIEILAGEKLGEETFASWRYEQSGMGTRYRHASQILVQHWYEPRHVRSLLPIVPMANDRVIDV